MKNILDACCGSKMFWFDKENPDVEFMDIRKEDHILCDGRHLKINPGTLGDFRCMPFEDNCFSLVIFDPPHLRGAGGKGWQALKYGSLSKDWMDDISEGFSECFRVLKPTGVLIFKWNEEDIKVSEILKLTPVKPLIGHKSGKQNKTHWLTFMKY